MGCNCGKKRKKDGGTQQFQLRLPTGESKTYKSRLEAEAARVRAGNRGSIVTTTTF